MKVEIERERLLSNFEVFEHLKEIQRQNNWMAQQDNAKKPKRSLNPDLESITRDLSSYLSKTPVHIQSVDSITECMKDLSKYSLEKIEKLQIINSTPYSMVSLYSVIEECDQRFSEDEINDILEIIQTHFPIGEDASGEGNEEYDEDEVMVDQQEEEIVVTTT